MIQAKFETFHFADIAKMATCFSGHFTVKIVILCFHNVKERLSCYNNFTAVVDLAFSVCVFQQTFCF
jgi:hypothetical protein